MSYILDALKKADADRERETAAVPDLHAQGDATSGGRSSAHRAGWSLLAIAAAAVALIVLAWQWFGASPEDATPALARVEAPMPPVPALAQSPAPLPAAPAPPNVRPAQTPAAPTPAPPARAPAIAAVSPSPRALAPAQPRTAAPATPLAANKLAAPAPAASAARPLTLAELPADLRNQMPALTVNGSVYSPKPAGRLVILNGQVFREGDKPSDGLTVEQIGLKSTVMAFRGQRFELKH